MTVAHKSAAELGRDCGVTRQAVGKWVHGSGYPGSIELFKAADALGVSARWLLLGTGKMAPPVHLDDQARYALDLFAQLTPDDQAAVIKYCSALLHVYPPTAGNPYRKSVRQ